MEVFLLTTAIIFVSRVQSHSSNLEFPPGFPIGCASSSYQIEGAWNTDGKGENIWDHFVHTNQSRIMDGSTGDVACDSYHKYSEDVQLIKDIGFNHYRFSLSWSRILPTGHDNVINQAGVQYYHRLLDELKANNIEPMVTLYHWDLPQTLQELGGWANPLMARYFEDYARVVFREFGDKVKWWITLNEPRPIVAGYGSKGAAPGIGQPGVADYLATHTLLLAHGRAYRLYKKDFAPIQQGQIGITISAGFCKPKTESEEDRRAADRAKQFQYGIFAHPIFSKEGDYPAVVRERVDRFSKEEGYTSSRLPYFTSEEINMLRGSADFFGLNHYSSELVAADHTSHSVSKSDDGVILSADPSWKKSAACWLLSVPWGMRAILNSIKEDYNNAPVFITENGWCTAGDDPHYLQDSDRVQYFHDYLEQMLKAIHEDGCNVIGYTMWTLMDNFEWAAGYRCTALSTSYIKTIFYNLERFGIHHVDFSNPKRPRTKKKSAEFFQLLIKTRKLPDVVYDI